VVAKYASRKGDPLNLCLPQDADGDALGDALAPSFARAEGETRTLECAAWLTLFAEASAISDDDRLPAAAKSAPSMHCTRRSRRTRRRWDSKRCPRFD